MAILSALDLRPAFVLVIQMRQYPVYVAYRFLFSSQKDPTENWKHQHCLRAIKRRRYHTSYSLYYMYGEFDDQIMLPAAMMRIRDPSIAAGNYINFSDAWVKQLE